MKSDHGNSCINNAESHEVSALVTLDTSTTQKMTGNTQPTENNLCLSQGENAIRLCVCEC